jgi:regulatory protein YycI of two-component signal transduction system YycFG
MFTNNIFFVLFLIILLFVCINFLPYNHIVLGSGDNDDNDDENNNNNNNDIKEKEEKEKDDGDDDDVPFILPVPFP